MLSLSLTSLALLWGGTLLTACDALRQDADNGKASPNLRLPAAYEAQFIFSIPYTAEYLPKALEYPVHLWVNRENDMMRLDVDSDDHVSGVEAWGLDSSVQRDGALYFRTPRISKYTCLASGADEQMHAASKGMAHVLSSMHHDSARHDGRKLLQDVLPSFSEWKFDSALMWRGVKAEKWTYKRKVEQRVSHYLVIVSLKGEVLYLHSMGSEVTTGAHYDEYIMDFQSFKEMPVDDLSPFTLPPECSETPLEIGSQPMAIALASLAPDALFTRTDFSDFSEAHGREHADAVEARQRAHAYVHHSLAIKRHNLQPARRFTLAENRYADWLEPEFKQLLGFKRPPDATASISTTVGGKPDLERRPRTVFQHTEGGAELPDSCDWRGTGAVGIVKDQGVCGSCWAFSASQVISSAHWMSTGEYVSLSEQQIMDCSWTYGYNSYKNSACDGGWPELGVQYTIDHGGSYEEKDYPYLGVDNFCKAEHGKLKASPAVHMSGVRFVEQYNREAVKEALVTYGPLSIGVDAEPVPFRFYSSGVLDTVECSSLEANIDHAVLLVGYGVESGVEYWIVKNEWSAYWGDGGYIKIAMDHDCAVTAEAFFVTT